MISTPYVEAIRVLTGVPDTEVLFKWEYICTSVLLWLICLAIININKIVWRG